ncbi:aminoglycoside 6'-N-acetyltransferase I [Nannocystis exedens]|uniref:Aminoglycoside 6'-N-acetyltransferase I n=1 Tax=Nannocystis exedens TaxID=54 RepID=A0A1I2AEP0_9BACT|nr:GNAT family N-acetyltransferase [Nannocystis exedens]PCC69801.1 aminoglycoside adenylyltransferase [Nannocystis exedens]SFE42441.1 aminoglycoside 6'-N-acetyltransferase I [Nannocystis exedens]
MTTEVRALGPGEAGLLERVADDVFDDPIVPARAREFLADPHHHLVVAIEDDVVVGMVSAIDYLHPDKADPELWINEVGVASSHRGRGLGQALLQATLALGRELGCRVAWVATDRSNTPAMRLYAAAGGAEEPQETVLFTFRLE